MKRLRNIQTAFAIAVLQISLVIFFVAAPVSASGGYTWASSPSAPGCGVNRAMSGNGQWVVCAPGSGDISVSSDYGATFNVVASGSRDWDAVAVSETGQYMVGVTDGDHIYMSSDYGANWVDAYATSFSWSDVAISGTGQYITAVANSQVYISGDYGATWSAGSTFSINPSFVHISASGKYQMALLDYVYTSSDYGVTWAPQTGSGLHNWRGLGMSSDGQFAAAVDVGGYIYTSSDRGVTWTAQTGSGARDWFGVAVSTDGAKLVASDNNIGTGGFFLSTDFGTTWTMDTDLGGGSFGPPIASYDLSRAFVEGPSGFSYAYNPAFVVQPPVSTPAPSSSSGPAPAVGAPDTGFPPQGSIGATLALFLSGLFLAHAAARYAWASIRKK